MGEESENDEFSNDDLKVIVDFLRVLQKVLADPERKKVFNELVMETYCK